MRPADDTMSFRINATSKIVSDDLVSKSFQGQVLSKWRM